MMEGFSQEELKLPSFLMTFTGTLRCFLIQRNSTQTDFYLRIKKDWVLLGGLLFLVAPGIA
jgi:hypothetical protein